MRHVTRPLAVVLAALVAGCGVAKYDDVPRPVEPPPVEIAPPVISQSPLARTKERSASFAFAAADAAAPGAFRCRLDEGELSACTSPVSYEALADGSHTFTVEQVDAAGVGHAKTYTWSVDGTAPAVSITGHPDPRTASTTATFDFGATDASGATFRCSVDGAELADCQPGASYGPLGDGDHRFAVEATDPLGNSTVASSTWTVDTTGPTIDAAGPATMSGSGAAVFTFSGTDGSGPVTFQCRVDDGALAPCESGQRHDVADGPHAFTLEARDALGNVSRWQRAWTVDTAAPAVTLSVEPATLTSSTSARFEFSATDQGGGVSFGCTLDGASTSCTSPSSYTVSDGPHTFTVTATDGLGHSAAASHGWTVDATGPALAFTTQPRDSTDRNAGFIFTATDANGPVTVTCSLDGAAAEPCTSPVALTITSNEYSLHRFTVQGQDGLGNTSSVTSEWTVSFYGACNRNGVRDPLEGCDDGNGFSTDGCSAYCAAELDYLEPIATVDTSGPARVAVTASGAIYLRQSGSGAAPDSFLKITGDPAVITSDAVPGVLGRGGDVMAIGDDLVFGGWAQAQSGATAYLQRWTASTNTTTTLSQFAAASAVQSFAVNTAVDRVFYAGASGPIFKATGPSTSAPFWSGNVTDLLYDRARDRLIAVSDGNLKVDASGGAGAAASFADVYSNLYLRDVAVDPTGMIYATCYTVDPATNAMTPCSSPGALVAIQLSNPVRIGRFAISSLPITGVAYDPATNSLVLLTTEQLAGGATVRTRLYRVWL